MAYIKTKDGTKLYAKVWGEGRPVVLIHGWPLSADTWDPHAMDLADAGFRVIAYDRRGFGRSEQPWTGYEYDTLSDDLADVLAATDAQDAALVGFSMGGGEVARYMSRHEGKNVQQAVLVSSIVPYMLQTDDNPAGVPQSVLEEIASKLKEDRPGFYGEFFKDFYGVGIFDKAVSDECLQWTRAMAMQGSLKATIDCTVAFGSTDFRSELSSFRVPTLVVHGTDDQTVPIDCSGRPAAAGIPNAKLIEYDGAPHGLLVTHQQRLRDDLLEFLLA